MLFIGTAVLIFIIGRVLCVNPDDPQSLLIDQCIARRTIVSEQSQLDEFVINVSSHASEHKCVELLLVGNSFNLDLLQMMRTELGANGSLMVTGNSPSSSVVVNCISNVTDPEELRDMLQPISRAQLVIFDGLVFTKCPVPIVIEEVYNVMILNCVFL